MPGKSHGQRSMVGSSGSLRVRHDWATSLSLFTFMHWRRKCSPRKCSCLENPRDGGAWWVAIYGVTQSRTRLKQLSSSSSSSRQHGFDPWFGKISYPVGQLRLCAAATQPTHPRACKPQLLSSCTAATEVHMPSSPCSTIRGATATREAHTLQLESSPCSPQLEKAHIQQWRACAPDRRLKNRKDSHTKGSPLMGGEISWDRKGASESQRRAQEPACGRWAEQTKTWTYGLCHCPELFSLRHMSMVQTRAGCWTWCLEDRPRERISIGCTETAKRGWGVVRQ